MAKKKKKSKTEQRYSDALEKSIGLAKDLLLHKKTPANLAEETNDKLEAATLAVVLAFQEERDPVRLYLTALAVDDTKEE